MNKLYLVGQVLNFDNKSWEFCGIYDDEKAAVERCTNQTFFVAEVKLNGYVPDESTPFERAYYPKINDPNVNSEIENYRKECRERWMSNFSPTYRKYTDRILPLRPDIGFFINVEGLDIGQHVFPKEYEAASNALFSVGMKMKQYVKDQNNN